MELFALSLEAGTFFKKKNPTSNIIEINIRLYAPVICRGFVFFFYFTYSYTISVIAIFWGLLLKSQLLWGTIMLKDASYELHHIMTISAKAFTSTSALLHFGAWGCCSRCFHWHHNKVRQGLQGGVVWFPSSRWCLEISWGLNWSRDDRKQGPWWKLLPDNPKGREEGMSFKLQGEKMSNINWFSILYSLSKWMEFPPFFLHLFGHECTSLFYSKSTKSCFSHFL